VSTNAVPDVQPDLRENEQSKASHVPSLKSRAIPVHIIWGAHDPSLNLSIAGTSTRRSPRAHSPCSPTSTTTSCSTTNTVRRSYQVRHNPIEPGTLDTPTRARCRQRSGAG
jgi:hypothetical protein